MSKSSSSEFESIYDKYRDHSDNEQNLNTSKNSNTESRDDNFHDENGTDNETISDSIPVNGVAYQPAEVSNDEFNEILESLEKNDLRTEEITENETLDNGASAGDISHGS